MNKLLVWLLCILTLQASAQTAGMQPPSPTSAKVISGKSYAASYSGSDFTVKLQNCINDSVALSNSNSTHLCDATGLTGSLTGANPVAAGTTAGAAGGLIMPCGAIWTWTNTSGVSFSHYGGFDVIGSCPLAGPAGETILANSSGSNPAAIYEAFGTSGSNYLHASGFNVTNVGGHTTTSGYAAIVNGIFADGSFLEGVNIHDSVDSGAILFRNVCCGFTYTHGNISASYGGTPLTIQADSSSYVQGLIFSEASIVGNGVGHPLISCTDTRSPHDSHITFTHGYSETSNSDTTTPLVQDNQCSAMEFDHWQVGSNVASNTAPWFGGSITSGETATVDAMQFYSSLGAWTYPVTVFPANFTGSGEPARQTDSNGNFNHSSVPSSPSFFGVVNATGIYTPYFSPSVIYSAAGTALPACSAGAKGNQATVSDATSPTFLGAYTSGGTVTVPVVCSYNGTTYTWLVN